MTIRYLIVEANSISRPCVLSFWKSQEDARAEIERLSSVYAADGCDVEGDYDYNDITRPDGSSVVQSIQSIVIE